MQSFISYTHSSATASASSTFFYIVEQSGYLFTYRIHQWEHTSFSYPMTNSLLDQHFHVSWIQLLCSPAQPQLLLLSSPPYFHPLGNKPWKVRKIMVKNNHRCLFARLKQTRSITHTSQPLEVRKLEIWKSGLTKLSVIIIPRMFAVVRVLWRSWDGRWNLFQEPLVFLLEMWSGLHHALPAS